MSASPVSRARILRRRALSLELRMIQRGSRFELRESGGLVFVGALSATETYLGERYQAKHPGPAQARTPAAWREPIDGYCLHAAAAGQTASTIRARRMALARMGRELRCPPAEVTAEKLIVWFGRQDWKPETRRMYRSAARQFFRWAYRAGVVPTYLPDDLPAVRVPGSVARPVPDDAWTLSFAAAEPRVALMMRLAAEAGLRRAEVAQVHTRDVLKGAGGAQLVVFGKGGRTRVLPISDSLAEVLRRGAAGHTPNMPAVGWLFPTGIGGHLTPAYVGVLVARALPDGWSMHKLRHRFATRAYRGSRNLPAVQQLLGHASLVTTQRYVAVDDDEIRAAMMSAASDGGLVR